MNLSAAIKNLEQALALLKGIRVQNEKKEKGGRGDLLTITPGPHERERIFGASKVKQSLKLLFETNNPDPAHIASQLNRIGEVIQEDRRRGGNAQTTEFVEEWEDVLDEGREGVALEAIARIVINAS